MNSTNVGTIEYHSESDWSQRATTRRVVSSANGKFGTRGKDGSTYLVAALLHLLQRDALAAKKQIMVARRLAMQSNNEMLLTLCMASEACLAAQRSDAEAVHACLARATELARAGIEDNNSRTPRALGRQLVKPLLSRSSHAASVTEDENVVVPVVRVVTVGRFGISVGDRNLDFTRIRQKKPFELLKVFIALGGREVPVVRLHDTLWPDADGDAAHRCFTITLHRLRRIVGADFITFQGGRVSLDPRRCNVDVWDVERQICALEALLSSDSVTDISAGAHQLLVLYQRPFLEGEEAHWVISMRERLREKCLRVLALAAQALHRAGFHPEAMDCCQKGIDLDPLMEDLYRLRMSSQSELGQSAAAVTTYRLCQAVLQRELGVGPSAATEATYQQVLARSQV